MAMSQMMSGGDKGSNNPLNKLSNQFQQDRGAQRDIYNNARAGPSRQNQPFRTPQPSTSQHQQPLHPQGVFDVSSLAQALQHPSSSSSSTGSAPAAPAGWASAFLQQQGQQLGRNMGQREREEMNRVYQNVQRGGIEGGLDWRTDFIRFERENAAALHLPPDHVAALDRAFAEAARAPNWAPPHLPQPHYLPPQNHLYQQQQQQLTFQQQPSSSSSTQQLNQDWSQPSSPTTVNPTSSSLSETASLLLNSVDQQTSSSSSSPDQQAKFQNSTFMGLMRQFKDGSADVKGEELVQSQTNQTSYSSREGEEGWAQAFSDDQDQDHHQRTAGGTMGKGKGKGKARDHHQGPWSSEEDASTSSQRFQQQSWNAYSHPPQSSGFAPQIPLQHLRHQNQSHSQPINQTPAKTISSWDAQFDAVAALSTTTPHPSSAAVHFADTPLFSDSKLELQHDTHILGSSSAWEEILDDHASALGDYQNEGQENDEGGEMQDEEAFRYYNGDSRMWKKGGSSSFSKKMGGRGNGVGVGVGVNEREVAERERMMDLWEEGLATTTDGGEEESARYVFQEGNPWVDERWARGRIGGEEGDAFQSVLEQEARVLRDPGNAKEWYDLGVKQQEHERESLAILALEKSLSILPSSPSPYLALAVSHTNNNDRLSTFSALESWITLSAEANPAYATSLAEARKREMGLAAGGKERFDWIVSALVGFARSGGGGGGEEVDADVQIALGVLFNTSGEFEHAQDCFRTALQVRPDDWQLYNRLGATLANGGRAEEAHDFYWKALELRPSFVRARFNLGISCINLKRYEEAASHILTALRLQHTDSTADLHQPAGRSAGAGSKGIGSDTLWETLRNSCTYLHRSDLVELCDRKDLEAFDGVEETFGSAEEWTPPIMQQ